MGISWKGVGSIRSSQYICFYCGTYVGAHNGYKDQGNAHKIMICPNTDCNKPTYFEGGRQIPAPRFGSHVAHLPEDVNTLYEEARACTGANACTATVLACRKLLMHIAVQKGAKPGQTFVEYVNHLSDKRFVPPDSEAWVDLIRQKGNEANQEIVIMSEKDAQQLLGFLEMLLRFMYEFPGKFRTTAPPQQTN
jgi:hypothetical protein